MRVGPRHEFLEQLLVDRKAAQLCLAMAPEQLGHVMTAVAILRAHPLVAFLREKAEALGDDRTQFRLGGRLRGRRLRFVLGLRRKDADADQHDSGA